MIRFYEHEQNFSDLLADTILIGYMLKKHVEAWRALAYLLLVWKARPVSRPIPAFCKEFKQQLCSI